MRKRKLLYISQIGGGNSLSSLLLIPLLFLLITVAGSLTGCEQPMLVPDEDVELLTRTDSLTAEDSIRLGIVLTLDTTWAGHIYEHY